MAISLSLQEICDDIDLFRENDKFLHVSDKGIPKIMLLRVISGTIAFKHNLNGTEFRQFKNYCKRSDNIFKSKITPKKVSSILKELISPEVKNKKFLSVISNPQFLYSNVSFHQNLLNEFTNFSYYQYRESYTTAFIYLYRILEYISYAFPMIYSAKTKDFLGSYDKLQSWFQGKEKGEREFFKIFLNSILDDETKKTPIDIYITADTQKIQRKIYTAIIKSCGKEIFQNLEHNDYSKLTTSFIDFHSVLINVRNRFFHLLNSGQPNLSSNDVFDSDKFFELINDTSAYWLSFVTLEVIKFEIEKS